jgi:cytochrome c biogenesis protein CcmG/thiol:disulfide interchange protein DsbE
MIVRYAFYIAPLVALLLLAGFLFAELSHQSQRSPEELPSVFVDKPAPQVLLPPLDTRAKAFSSADLRSGHVTVVNLFASWCVPCRAETPALQELAREPGVELYGIVYKDAPQKARAFLDDVGNPYSRIDLDADGRAGIDWGIQGVPETFVIDSKGIVHLRFEGPIVGDILSNTILPAVREAQAPG